MALQQMGVILTLVKHVLYTVPLTSVVDLLTSDFSPNALKAFDYTIIVVCST